MTARLSHNEAHAYRDAAFLFLLVGIAIAVWLGLNLRFPGLRETGIPTTTVRVVIHLGVLIGLWLGLMATDFDRWTKIKVWLAVAIPFTAWLALAWGLAVQGAFRPDPIRGAPQLPLAIFAPILLAAPLLLRSRRIAAVLDATPAYWLIALQTYRVFGGIFLVSWSRGEISGAFALPAGTGDMLVGLLALPVAALLRTGVPGSRTLAIGWNVLGIADLAVAVSMGMMTAPGPLQVIVPEVPNAMLGTFPTVMIPAFAVPSSILLHILSLRQLRRLQRDRLATS